MFIKTQNGCRMVNFSPTTKLQMFGAQTIIARPERGQAIVLASYDSYRVTKKVFEDLTLAFEKQNIPFYQMPPASLVEI